ncbi:putative glycerol-3-phosphate acyltransferase 3 [Drosera capensis]
MGSYDTFYEAFKIFVSNIIYHKQSLSISRYLQRRSNFSQKKLQRQSSFVNRFEDQFSDHTMVFTFEEALLKSTSLFPFFMLVAFEAGSPLRAMVMLAMYPLVCLMRKEWGLKLMIMVVFFGINKESFYKVGRSVMPKFFLEDTGLEGLEVLKKFKRKVAYSHMPRVMVESFLREYVKVDHVVGCEIKEFRGYFIGLVEDNNSTVDLKTITGEEDMSSKVIGMCGSRRSLQNPVFSACKEIHVIRRAERKAWTTLPKEKYLKPLIFHDSRLVSKPTPSTTIAVLMWLPFAFFLFILRTFCFVFLPPNVARPIMCFSGCRVLFSEAKSTKSSETVTNDTKHKGLLYVCNHRTLSDPVYLKMALDKNVTALTYSLSKMSELISPIRTVRLTRNREKDAAKMEKLLIEGNVAVCAEGTTCREPYLLRFSPLFAEMSDVIVPVALDTSFTMFYGNTAGGYKFLDPVFFLMDPHPSYTIQLLEKVKGLATCQDHDGAEVAASKFDLANRVQAEIGHALGFECTMLTRKDKYLILAGNDGLVRSK